MTNRAYQERESSEDWASSSQAPEKAGANAIAFLVGSWREAPTKKIGEPDLVLWNVFGESAARRASSMSVETALSENSTSNQFASESSLIKGLEAQMTSFSAKEEDDFERLRKEYVLVNASIVEVLLRNHRSLIDLLLEAVVHLRASFGTDAVIQLRLGFDEGDEPNIVCGIVQWTRDSQAARAALDAFDDSWWMNNVGKAFGRVVFDYELA